MAASPKKSHAKVATEMPKASQGNISLQKLKDGNARYLSGNMQGERELGFKREAAKTIHEPMAVILGCSDARIPPEYIFDQSVGDLFVVRVIGNIVGTLQMDSLEYAAHILKSPLIVVMGHEACGAVRAVLEGTAVEEDEEHIIPFIEPAIEETRNMPGDHLTNAIKANVAFAANMMLASKVIGPLVKEGKVKIVGAYYNLQTGKVDFFDCPAKPAARHLKEEMP